MLSGPAPAASGLSSDRANLKFLVQLSHSLDYDNRDSTWLYSRRYSNDSSHGVRVYRQWITCKSGE